MTAVEILQSIISILVGGIVGIGEGIGKGVSAIVKNLFFNLSEQGAITGLSEFGIVICIFAGVGLAIGLSYKIYTMVATFGARK